MAGVKLIVAYPQPTDTETFEKIYTEEHVPLAIAKLDGKTKIVATKIKASPQGTPAFYRVAEIHFPSMAALGSMCGFAGRKGSPAERVEDFFGWAARDYDRRRRKLHILVPLQRDASEAGAFGFTRLMEETGRSPRAHLRSIDRYADLNAKV